MPDPISRAAPDAIGRLLERQGFVVLDGGLGTELEALGCDLSDPLWSAKALFDDPERTREAHRRFLEAGADVIATATYQATFPGLREHGLEDRAIETLLRAAVELAIEVRDAFWADETNRAAERDGVGRARPLVAASIGPYGAYLADGSEYRGAYGLGLGDLYDFHAPRWEVLAGTDADVIACETTPSHDEVLAYCRLAAVSGRPTWISFQCADETHLADGTPLQAVAAICEDEPNVIAVGVNCVDPRLVGPLIEAVRRGTGKPLLVYPNSGETWDAESKAWRGAVAPTDWTERALQWARAGAAGIGGCCRVRPADIAAIRTALAS